MGLALIVRDCLLGRVSSTKKCSFGAYGSTSLFETSNRRGRGRMNPVDNFVLMRLRAIAAAGCLQALADYSKKASSFHPGDDQSTTRWHAYVAGQDVELFCTGPKFSMPGQSAVVVVQ